MHTRWKALAAACAAALAFSSEQRARAHARGARRRPADGSVRRELLVLRELPDGAEPVQRREHARHQLGHRLLGRPGLRRRLRRVPHLRRLQAGAEARLRHALLRAAGRPVGVRPRWRRQGRHARAVRRQRARRPELRRRARRQERRTGRYPGGAWEGLRVFDISDPTAPAQVAAVYQDCGSHTNTLLPAPDGKSMYVLNSSYPLGDGPTCGPLGAAQGRKVNHGVVQVIEVPFDDPAAAPRSTELPVVYPGDADGTYKPVSEHGIAAPLDDFLGCHDLSSFPKKGIVGAACGEQAQVWNIDEATGLPDTENPRWAYDQPNVDFWHSATFSWDGKVANFIDESFGDGCPTVTTKTGGLPAAAPGSRRATCSSSTRGSGELLSEYRNPRPSNDRLAPEGGDRLTYCSSHLGIPVPSTRPLPAGQRVLPRRLVGDRLHRPDARRGRSRSPTCGARTPGPPTRTRAGRARRGASRCTPTTA